LDIDELAETEGEELIEVVPLVPLVLTEVGELAVLDIPRPEVVGALSDDESSEVMSVGVEVATPCSCSERVVMGSKRSCV